SRGALDSVFILLAGGPVCVDFGNRVTRRIHLLQSAVYAYVTPDQATVADWNVAGDKVKAERDASLGGALEIPPELRHYDERYWFLATQVAEIEKYKVHTCQDYLDLSRMIERH